MTGYIEAVERQQTAQAELLPAIRSAVEWLGNEQMLRCADQRYHEGYSAAIRDVLAELP